MATSHLLILLSFCVGVIVSRESLSANDELRKGETLVSSNGKYKAVFEENGNLVVYQWSPVWSTNTAGREGLRLLLQTDTNLVIYRKDNKPVWSSAPSVSAVPQPQMRLTLTNGGHLEVDNAGSTIWSSANSAGNLIPQ